MCIQPRCRSFTQVHRRADACWATGLEFPGFPTGFGLSQLFFLRHTPKDKPLKMLLTLGLRCYIFWVQPFLLVAFTFCLRDLYDRIAAFLWPSLLTGTAWVENSIDLDAFFPRLLGFPFITYHSPRTAARGTTHVDQKTVGFSHPGGSMRPLKLRNCHCQVATIHVLLVHFHGTT